MRLNTIRILNVFVELEPKGGGDFTKIFPNNICPKKKSKKHIIAQKLHSQNIHRSLNFVHSFTNTQRDTLLGRYTRTLLQRLGGDMGGVTATSPSAGRQEARQKQKMLMEAMKRRQAQFRATLTDSDALLPSESQPDCDEDSFASLSQCVICLEHRKEKVALLGMVSNGAQLNFAAKDGKFNFPTSYPIITNCGHAVHQSCLKHKSSPLLENFVVRQFRCPACRTCANCALVCFGWQELCGGVESLWRGHNDIKNIEKIEDKISEGNEDKISSENNSDEQTDENDRIHTERPCADLNHSKIDILIEEKEIGDIKEQNIGDSIVILRLDTKNGGLEWLSQLLINPTSATNNASNNNASNNNGSDVSGSHIVASFNDSSSNIEENDDVAIGDMGAAGIAEIAQTTDDTGPNRGPQNRANSARANSARANSARLLIGSRISPWATLRADLLESHFNRSPPNPIVDAWALLAHAFQPIQWSWAHGITDGCRVFGERGGNVICLENGGAASVAEMSVEEYTRLAWNHPQSRGNLERRTFECENIEEEVGGENDIEVENDEGQIKGQIEAPIEEQIEGDNSEKHKTEWWDYSMMFWTTYHELIICSQTKNPQFATPPPLYICLLRNAALLCQLEGSERTSWGMVRGNCDVKGMFLGGILSSRVLSQKRIQEKMSDFLAIRTCQVIEQILSESAGFSFLRAIDRLSGAQWDSNPGPSDTELQIDDDISGQIETGQIEAHNSNMEKHDEMEGNKESKYKQEDIRERAQCIYGMRLILLSIAKGWLNGTDSPIADFGSHLPWVGFSSLCEDNLLPNKIYSPKYSQNYQNYTPPKISANISPSKISANISPSKIPANISASKISSNISEKSSNISLSQKRNRPNCEDRNSANFATYLDKHTESDSDEKCYNLSNFHEDDFRNIFRQVYVHRHQILSELSDSRNYDPPSKFPPPKNDGSNLRNQQPHTGEKWATNDEKNGETSEQNVRTKCANCEKNGKKFEEKNYENCEKNGENIFDKKQNRRKAQSQENLTMEEKIYSNKYWPIFSSTQNPNHLSVLLGDFFVLRFVVEQCAPALRARGGAKVLRKAFKIPRILSVHTLSRSVFWLRKCINLPDLLQFNSNIEKLIALLRGEVFRLPASKGWTRLIQQSSDPLVRNVASLNLFLASFFPTPPPFSALLSCASKGFEDGEATWETHSKQEQIRGIAENNQKNTEKIHHEQNPAKKHEKKFAQTNQKHGEEIHHTQNTYQKTKDISHSKLNNITQREILHIFKHKFQPKPNTSILDQAEEFYEFVTQNLQKFIPSPDKTIFRQKILTAMRSFLTFAAWTISAFFPFSPLDRNIVAYGEGGNEKHFSNFCEILGLENCKLPLGEMACEIWGCRKEEAKSPPQKEGEIFYEKSLEKISPPEISPLQKISSPEKVSPPPILSLPRIISPPQKIAHALSEHMSYLETPKTFRIPPPNLDLLECDEFLNFISLPDDYSHFLYHGYTRTCAYCQCSPTDRMTCLFCGMLVCFSCTGPIKLAFKLHVKECSGGQGIFLLNHRCAIFLVYGDEVSAIEAPFVDKYGETDGGITRGFPLHLSPPRLRSLKRSFFQGELIRLMKKRPLDGSPRLAVI